LGSSVRKGQRNSHLTRVAGWFQRENYPTETILSTVWKANQDLCEPPLDQKEVRRIVESVTRYAPNPEAAVSSVESDSPLVLKWQGLGSLLTEESVEPDWIIENRLAQGDICILAGAPEAGKSWFALELAIASASLRPIMGLPPVFGRLRTMMLDEENTFDEYKRRSIRIANAHGLTKQRDRELLEQNVQFLNQAGATFSTPSFFELLLEKTREFQPHIIVIDSATAMSGVKDENNAVEVRAFTTQKLSPLRQICNSTIIIIHHTNKQAYLNPAERTGANQGLIRGSIDWLAGADSSWLLQKEGEEQRPYIKLSQTKQRRGFPPEPLKVRLVDTPDGLGTRPMVLNPPGQEQQARRRRNGQRSKRTEGMVAILGWLRDQDAAQFETLDKKDVLDQSMLYASGLEQFAHLTRKDLSNSLVAMVQRGIFVELEDPSSNELDAETANRRSLMSLTISQEEIITQLTSVG
jgi:hypothetical protein